MIITERNYSTVSCLTSRSGRQLTPIPGVSASNGNAPLLPVLFLTNARSLNNKVDEVTLVLNQHCVDVALGTATWFTDHIIQPANIPHFNLE